MTTINQLVGITGQYNEIVKRVGNGSLDPAAVKRAFQDIIEGKLPIPTWNPPTWWRTPEQQLTRARQLWPHTVLPEPPKGFAPRTKSEVLLLHVPSSFDDLWNEVVAPTGYTKCMSTDIATSKRYLRFSPKKREYTGPAWIAFDPEHGRGKCPNSSWGEVNIAASEVFSALIQFPEWPLAWFNDASAPNLSGYRLKDDGVPYVPYLTLQRADSKFKLDMRWAGLWDNAWSSPSVREC